MFFPITFYAVCSFQLVHLQSKKILLFCSQNDLIFLFNLIGNLVIVICIETSVYFLVGLRVLILCVSCGGNLAELSAGVGELLAGRGQDGKSGKVLMTDWWRDETQSHNHESHGN